MNTANLQIEGILMAMAAVLESMRRKGLLTAGEIDEALTHAEGAASREVEARDELRHAHLEAIRFPIRFLKISSNLAEGDQLTFRQIAAMVGDARSDAPRET